MRVAIAAVSNAVEEALRALDRLDGPQLKARRRQKFLEMGRKGLG